MANCLEKLISNILRNFDQFKLSSIRHLCRDDPKNTNELAEILLEAVKKDDLVARYNCVLTVDEFFKRSHEFRKRIIENLHAFLLYTVETDPLHFPIVGPKPETKKLKNKSLQVVYEWHKVYGKFYKKLSLAVEYLKLCKTVDVDHLRAETVVERRRVSEKVERENDRRRFATDKVRSELKDISSELEICLKELENGFELLIPRENIDVVPTESSNNLGAHGILPSKQSLEIDVQIEKNIPVEKTSDNADLLKTIEDSYKILRIHFSPKVNSWLKTLTANSADDGLTKVLIDYRRRCYNMKEKYQELKIFSRKNSSDEEDDFIEVTDSGEHKNNFSSLIDDPEVPLRISRVACDFAHQSTLTSGVDFFDQDQPSTSRLTRNDSDSDRIRWPSSELDEGAASSSITYTSLLNGAICQRMDREKCPFHGPIKDKVPFSTTVERSWKDSAFSDHALIKEIESVTGVKLTEPEKKKKNVKTRTEKNSRVRLMKKITNPSSVKSVIRR